MLFYSRRITSKAGFSKKSLSHQNEALEEVLWHKKKEKLALDFGCFVGATVFLIVKGQSSEWTPKQEMSIRSPGSGSLVRPPLCQSSQEKRAGN